MTVWRILLSSAARKKRDRRANQNDGVPMVTAIIQLSLLFILLANFVRSYTHSIGQKARSTFFIAYKCKYHFQIISWQQWSMSWQCFIFNFVFLAFHLFGQGRILFSQITHWFGNKKKSAEYCKRDLLLSKFMISNLQDEFTSLSQFCGKDLCLLLFHWKVLWCTLDIPLCSIHDFIQWGIRTMVFL